MEQTKERQALAEIAAQLTPERLRVVLAFARETLRTEEEQRQTARKETERHDEH